MDRSDLDRRYLDRRYMDRNDFNRATDSSSDAYFLPLGDGRYFATDRVGGAWYTDEQHIAPLLGLLTHLVEVDRDARRKDGLVVAGLSFDNLGRIGLGEFRTGTEVVRPGRSVELVEAVATQGERDAVRLRAWLLRPGDTAAIAATTLEAIAPPEETEPWDPTTDWPGGFIASAEVRRRRFGPGRAHFWARTEVPLIAGGGYSQLAYYVGLLDIANGMTVRRSPSEVAFPNVDLSAKLFAVPSGEWVGFDTTVTFGANGTGVTSTVLHDRSGPIGVMGQTLTVRPQDG